MTLVTIASLELNAKRITAAMAEAKMQEQRQLLEDALSAVRFAITCVRAAEFCKIDLEIP